GGSPPVKAPARRAQRRAIALSPGAEQAERAVPVMVTSPCDQRFPCRVPRVEVMSPPARMAPRMLLSVMVAASWVHHVTLHAAVPTWTVPFVTGQLTGVNEPVGPGWKVPTSPSMLPLVHATATWASTRNVDDGGGGGGVTGGEVTITVAVPKIAPCVARTVLVN